MAQALRSEPAQKAFAVDLTKISRLAANRAHDYASVKTCSGNKSSLPLSEREGACEYFTYGWLKAISEELAALNWPVLSAHVLPSTEDGDAQVVDVVLVAQNGNAALDLVCSSLEVQYEQAARLQGFVSALKMHILPADEAKRGHALIGGLHSPALQFWP